MRVEIDESRVDWITCYARNGPKADLLEGYAQHVIDGDCQRGDAAKGSNFYGFSGKGTRHFKVGRGSYGVLVRAGGLDASDHFAHLSILADHVSRVDYCVTGRSTNAKFDPVAAIVERKRHDDPERPRMPPTMLHKEIWEGSTAELARRESAIFGRVYDKHKESGGEYPPGTWRWEVELKRYASEQEHERWHGRTPDGQSVLELVSTQFQRWGIRVPWDSRGDAPQWHAPPRKRDVDAAADWLQRQVGPSARWVAEIYGVDRLHELLGIERPK